MGEITIQTYTLAFVWTVVLMVLGVSAIYLPIFDTYGITPGTDLNDTQGNFSEFQDDISLITGESENALNDQDIEDTEGNSLVAGWNTGKKLGAMNRVRQNLMRVMLRNGLIGQGYQYWDVIATGIIVTLVIISIILYMSFFRGYKAH